MDGWDLIDEWWRIYNPSPSNPADVESGKRAPAATSTGYMTYPGGVVQSITKGNQQTGTCQYWISGLAPVCTLWNASQLKCQFTGDGDKPSGYGMGMCDMLGRRSWCSHYEKSKDYDPNEFACVLPCVERSGKGRQIISENTMSFQPIFPAEIQGYNEKEGVGTCDGMGMGRGDKGPFETLEAAWAEQVVCRFYRPQIMGFGAYQPRPYHGSATPGRPFTEGVNYIPTSLAELHDQSPADPLSYMDPRLPFSFSVYNSRAMFQICAHWKSNRPAFFSVGSWGDNPHDFTIDLDEDPSGLCGCEDSLCDPYRTEIIWDPLLPPMLQYVWAQYGGVICNGAKPECPCYSGDWLFCTDTNMKDGMRISAEQLMELRFWASNWSSQEEYEEFYAKKPGPTQKGYADETTSSIYTFRKWLMIEDNDPNKSKMEGVKVDLCQPAPLHMREFIPDEFLIRTQLTYPPLGSYTGTNIQGEGVLYPTLVRELDPPPDYVPDLLIIYPYLVKDPWARVSCDANEDLTVCIHDINRMNSTPYISVVGYGPKESEVYVFNDEIAENISGLKSFVDQYVRATKIPGSAWSDFITACNAAISATDEQGDGMYEGVTTLTGYFHIDNVELKLNELNNLYVICKYSDYLSDDSADGFTFRRIPVQTRFWGATITQSDALHTPSGDVLANNFPVEYDAPLVINGQVNTLQGEVLSVVPAYFLYVYTTTGMDYAYYSYCINRDHKENQQIDTWAQVGPTGYIWVEIENIDINYLTGFGVEKATMTYSAPADEDGNRRVVGMCGKDPDTSIELEVIYPSSTGANYDLERHTIPPNAVILKAPDPLPFFNSNWTLTMDYYCNVFSNSPGDDIAWPTGFDGGYFALNQFAPSPFSVTHSPGTNTFTIDSIGTATKRGTAKVVAFITDEDGRIQVAAATKLLMQGHKLRCRNVDIFYSYAADGTGYDLEPSTGFFTWSGTPSVNESTSAGLRHSKVAACGDHECGGECPPGFSWFPFNVCAHPDFYNVLNGAAQCTMKISEGDEAVAEIGSGAVRYGTAPEYRAWVTPGGNWASACGTSFYYHYSHAPFENTQFTGKANIRGKIDKLYYLFREWALPPFGNTARGAVERYLVRDFSSHIDKSGPTWRTRFRHMPMIVDIEDLQNQSLNCFETADRYSLAKDPFSCFPMMSHYVASFLDEAVGEDRYRWDEIVQVIYHGNCYYPWPLLEYDGVQRYGFLDNNHVWLWPEYWKSLERNLYSSHGEFKFLTVYPQEYYFDFVKEEHRFVVDEGQHTLVFEPPTGGEEEDDGEGDTKGKAYPSISLDGLFPRYFQIIYEDYDASVVDWMDESDTGEEGSSGGDGEDDSEQIYEKTCVSKTQGITFMGAPDEEDTEPKWIHDYNTIFGAGAEVEPNEDRKAFISRSLFDGRLYAYYNRGLIAHIPKNRLYYLPMVESNAGQGDDIYINENTTAEIRTFSVGAFGLAPVKVVVVGDWGIQPGETDEDDKVFSKAGITVWESTEAPVVDDDEVPDYSKEDYVDSITPAYGSQRDSLSRYTAELDCPRRPERFSRTIDHFTVSITPYASEELKIISVYAVLGQYTRAEEQIMVWERMYYPGVASFDSEELNADGPKTKTFRDYHRDRVGGGQYFPFNEDLTVRDPELEGAGGVISKLNMVNMTEVFTEDVKLSPSMSNLHEIEMDEQGELYTEAYDLDDFDQISYTGTTPPAIGEFLKSIGTGIDSAGGLTLSHYKVSWEKSGTNAALGQTNFWQPGGHFFKWSSSTFKTRCYIFGPVQEVYEVFFVHNKHAGTSSTLTAGQSYAGWGRLWYYKGKLANMASIGQTQEYATTDALTGAKNQVYTESR